VINESALIFEKNLQSYFDKIILVKAPVDLRVERVMKRDSSSEKEVRARIQLQNHESQIEHLSDFVINNDNSTKLESICLNIHNKLTNQ
jgi:dephospho-CoA kinase